MKSQLSVLLLTSALLSGCVLSDVNFVCSQDEEKYENDTDSVCQRFVCVHNQWHPSSDENSCGQVSCTLNTEQIASCGECKDGDVQCVDSGNGAQILTCSNGLWTKKSECSNVSCDNDGKSCGKCKNDALSFSDIKTNCSYRLCKQGNWEESSTPCSYLENPVSCTVTDEETACGKCMNSEIRCNDSEEGKAWAEICNNGQWEKSHDCNVNFCNEDKTDCGGCVIGSHRYSNNEETLICENESCEGGMWQTAVPEDCGDTPVSCHFLSDGAECGTCLEGNSKCTETNGINSIHTCENGIWIQKQVCDAGVSCTDTECGECKNGSTRCLESEEGSWVEVCNQAKWVKSSQCSVGYCNEEKTGCGGCTDKETQYANNPTTLVCESQTCADGVWQSATPVCNSSNVSCHFLPESAECGVCIEGSTQCAENNGITSIQTCENGLWKDLEECPAGVSCHDNTCGECKNGDFLNKNKADLLCHQFSCKNGVWKDLGTCNSTVSCKTAGNESVCGDCHNYTITRNGTNKINTCIDGAVKEFKCPNVIYTIKDIGLYVQCVVLLGGKSHDDLNCYNTSDLVGHYVSNDKTCSNKASCRVLGASETECGSCHENDIKCKDKDTEQTCINGDWGFDEKADCSCTESEKRCRNSVLQTCKNGIWDVVGNCSYGCHSEKAACKECTDGAKRCLSDKKTSQTCVDGFWAQDTVCDILCTGAGICGECEIGSKECTDEKNLRTCNSNGNWIPSTCTYGCDSQTPSCFDCESGTKKCDSSTLKTCTNGRWKSTSCTNGCDTKTTTCYDCASGKKTCDGSNLKTCVSGRWSSETCANGCENGACT